MIAVLIFLRHMFLMALHTAYIMERTLKGVSKRQCQYLQVLWQNLRTVKLGEALTGLSSPIYPHSIDEETELH